MITPVAVQDDTAALATHLFERYHAEVFAYLCRMLNDREWAQDLAQDAFLKVFASHGRLPGIQNQRAWIYRIATNLALNALKRRRRFAWLPWHAVESGCGGDAGEQVGRQAALEEALQELAPEYRAPLLLYAHYGLSVAEVAEALGLSETAVKTRLYRARTLFRQAYRGGGEQ